HLDIGNAFQMLDSANYELKHFSATGRKDYDRAQDSLIVWDTFVPGQWHALPPPTPGYRFWVPYEATAGGENMIKYKERDYLLFDNKTTPYSGYYRVDTIWVTIDTIW